MALVWTVVGYRMEIWGWKEREKMKRLQERFLRWVLGVEGRTPGYMIRKELQREKLRSRAGRRAWEYEERLREDGGSILARRCLCAGGGRKSDEEGGGEVKLGKGERAVLRGEGGGDKGVAGEKKVGEIGFEVVEERDRERQREER